MARPAVAASQLTPSHAGLLRQQHTLLLLAPPCSLEEQTHPGCCTAPHIMMSCGLQRALLPSYS